MKYAYGGMYCLQPLPLGRSYSERQEENVKERAQSLKHLSLAAFLGGLLGGGFGALIVLIIALIIR